MHEKIVLNLINTKKKKTFMHDIMIQKETYLYEYNRWAEEEERKVRPK